MSLADDLQKLDELRRNGSLSQEEFELAKKNVLAGSMTPSTPTQTSSNINHLVEQLDREWELERENYMITNKYGAKFIPQKWSSVLGGILIVGFGIFWTIMAIAMVSNSPFAFAGVFPIFGVLFVIFGLAMSVRSAKKADEYEKAHQRYADRRLELVRRSE